MVRLGSIYSCNIKKLETVIYRKESTKTKLNAKNKVAIAILKYRELIQKFNLEKMATFFDDHLYFKLFEIYAKSMLEGKFPMPDIMKRNLEVYQATFKKMITPIVAPKE
jgi:hypothetical protein